MVSSGLWNRGELKAEFFGALGEVVHDALPIALLEIVLPLIGVFRALGQHRVDQAGKLVGGGGDRLGSIESGTQATEIGAQGRLAAAQRGGGQAQGLRRPIGGALAGAREHLAPGNLCPRTQSQPRCEERSFGTDHVLRYMAYVGVGNRGLSLRIRRTLAAKKVATNATA